MLHSQQEAHIQRVLSHKVGTKIYAPKMSDTDSTKAKDSDSNRPSCSRQLYTETNSSSESIRKELSVNVDRFSEVVHVQRSVLDAMWAKANDLINDLDAICMVPGGNTKDRIVKSTSGPHPYTVTAKKLGKYSCDAECHNFNSMGICSHSVAVAEDNGYQSSLIRYVKPNGFQM